MGNLTPLLVIIFVFAIGFFIYLYIRDQRTKAELRSHGVTVTARVTNRHIDVQTDRDENGNTTTSETYHITYQYAANGTSHSRSQSVHRDIYEILREGQPVEVVYLPENPGEARLASSL